MERVVIIMLTLSTYITAFVKLQTTKHEIVIATILTTGSLYFNLKLFEEINKVLIVIISLFTIVFLALQCCKLTMWIIDKCKQRKDNKPSDKNNNEKD